MSVFLTCTHSLRIAAAAVTTVALFGCERVDRGTPEPSGELAWARAALERNPQLEVLAVDPQAEVITVKRRGTGEIQALKLSDLAAAPRAQLQAGQTPPAETTQTPALATRTPRATTPESVAAEIEPREVQPPVATAERAPAVPASTANDSSAADNYTIERTEGQVRVSGPGVSIVSSGADTADVAAGEGGQRTAEPIICEGRRMIHLDNRNIFVDGDAITARGGCELYITNSRIVASGTGIVVRDAVVHISNSHIEGAGGSFQADDRARLFVRGSTFQGVPRRTELARVQDQGGNRWR